VSRRKNETWAVVVICLIALSMLSAVAVAQTGGQNGQAVEPNDGPENAVPLDFSGSVVDEVRTAAVLNFNNQSNIPARFGPGDEDDWYSFEVEAGQTIRMWGYVGQGKDTAFLIGPDDQRLAEFGSFGDLRPTGLTVNQSGTYYIRMVNNSDISESTSYSFHVQVAQGDEFEPNDNQDAATAIAPDKSVSTTLTSATETDWYAVHANDGATINANISSLPVLNPGIKAPTSVDVFNAEGERISNPQQLPSGGHTVNTTTEYAGSTNASVVARSLDEGTYYIRVTADDEYVSGFSRGGFGFAPYRLTVSGEQLTPPPTTPTTTESPTQTSSDSNASTIKIKGTGSVVSYTFAASNISPGEKADIGDNTDQIDGTVVHGQTGKNGIDTYRFTGPVRRFEAERPATLNVWVNGERVEPTALGDSKQTTTSTATPTPTPTETGTPTSTRTATTTVPTVSTRTPSTENQTGTSTGNNGQILGGTATPTETSSSSGPGFGVVGALFAVLAAMALVARHD
jgi:PGF-CTERM protein